MDTNDTIGTLNIPREIIEIIRPYDISLYKTCKYFYGFVDIFYKGYIADFDNIEPMIKPKINKPDNNVYIDHMMNNIQRYSMCGVKKCNYQI